MFTRNLIPLLAFASLALAEGEPVTSVQLLVSQIDETRFQIGQVIIDKKSREIRFPALVNMTEGQLEYLIVHKNGKTHESLLSTRISPTNLNLAFTLLRYPPSRELYSVPTYAGEKPTMEREFPAEVRSAARVSIDMEWTEAGRTRRIPVNEWIQHGVTAASMPHGPWVYGASDFQDGEYTPEVSGDIAAIFLSNAAILNYSGDDNGNDEVWMPFPKRVPEEGTNVTVIIAPF